MLSILLLSMLIECTVNPIKLCKNCKFFKKPKNKDVVSGKCVLFPIIEDNVDFLITGRDKFITEHYYQCITARSMDDMCGKNGKLYQEKE
jgi:hypothetical protein